MADANSKDVGPVMRAKSQPKRDNVVFYPPTQIQSQHAGDLVKKNNLFDSQNEMPSQRLAGPRPLTRTRNQQQEPHVVPNRVSSSQEHCLSSNDFKIRQLHNNTKPKLPRYKRGKQEEDAALFSLYATQHVGAPRNLEISRDFLNETQKEAIMLNNKINRKLKAQQMRNASPDVNYMLRPVAAPVNPNLKFVVQESQRMNNS